jgi:predicted GTPase
MSTGEIDYITRVNRRNPTTSDGGEVHALYERRVETLMRYFFEDLPVYQVENRSQREIRRLVTASI